MDEEKRRAENAKRMKEIRKIAIELAKKANVPPDVSLGRYSFKALGPYLSLAFKEYREKVTKPKYEDVKAWDYIEQKAEKQREKSKNLRARYIAAFGKSFSSADPIQKANRDALEKTRKKILDAKKELNTILQQHGEFWYTIREKRKKPPKQYVSVETEVTEEDVKKAVALREQWLKEKEELEKTQKILAELAGISVSEEKKGKEEEKKGKEEEGGTE